MNGAEDFIAWDNRQRLPYEFRAGVIRRKDEICAGHAGIATNLVCLLRFRLKDRGCVAFQCGLKLKLPNGDVVCPDAMVVCRQIEPHVYWVDDPTLVAEILSPSTERDDRGEKWQGYRQLESLRHYLLIHQDRWRVVLFTRAGQAWEETVYAGPDAAIPLSAFDLSVRLADLYDETEIPAAGD